MVPQAPSFGNDHSFLGNNHSKEVIPRVSTTKRPVNGGRSPVFEDCCGAISVFMGPGSQAANPHYANPHQM